MTRWEPRDWPCPVCGSARRRFIGCRGGRAHREHHGVEANVVRCRACGCYYTHPTLLPTSNPYAAAAPDEYFHARLHDAGEKRDDGRRLAATAEAMLGRKGRLLELGCGRGELLEGARDAGWSVSGVEMTPGFAAAAAARGLVVEQGPVETAQLLEQKFDVILFAAILEHLYRPLDVLRRARRALPTGGLVFIAVPNEASLAMLLGNVYMRARGRDWSINLSPTFPPFHVVGFTPGSLRHALGETGFEVVQLEVPRWRSALPPGRGLASLIERKGLGAASWLGSKLGRGDGISCWARAM